MARLDLDRVADHVLVGPRIRARCADHGPERPERLVDQGEAELLHVVEVAVEGGRDDVTPLINFPELRIARL